MAEKDEARILVVEDEAIIGLEMESLLKQASCEVTACGSLQSALLEASRQDFDAAVLDLNLRGEMSFPIADALAAKNIPFVFVSGYEVEIVPRQHRRRPFVGKPYLSQKLLAAVFDAIKRARPLATSA
jgi:DNA-binding response OmpR family regulator